jgi:hypothetical protein
MKAKKNIGARIMATIALLAIVIGIVGTGILVIVGSLSSQAVDSEISQEELQDYINSLS